MNDWLVGLKAFVSRNCKKGSIVVMNLRVHHRLGRRAKYRRQAVRAERSRNVHASVFEPPNGRNEVSVDHLEDSGVTSDDEIAKIATEELAAADHKFYGWYVLTVRDVEKEECSVLLSPTVNNPYHADILYPETDTVDRRHHFRQFAQRLASHAHFNRWGQWD